MSAGWTPGPWHVQSDGQIWCDDHPIAERITTGPWGDVGVDFITGDEVLVHHWGTIATDEAKANAHLIAAAPDLYAALEGLVRYADAVAMSASMGKNQRARLEAAKAILAKARGNQ